MVIRVALLVIVLIRGLVLALAARVRKDEALALGSAHSRSLRAEPELAWIGVVVQSDLTLWAHQQDWDAEILLASDR